jgi:hypothetical protein
MIELRQVFELSDFLAEVRELATPTERALAGKRSSAAAVPCAAGRRWSTPPR